jgi:hypothetical protein
MPPAPYQRETVTMPMRGSGASGRRTHDRREAPRAPGFRNNWIPA